MPNKEQFTIVNMSEILLRNRKKFFAVFFLTMAAIILYWWAAPRWYGSEGRLFVQLGRANSGVQYTKGTMPISIQNARETEVRSVIEIIHSHEVLAKVCQDPEVTVDAILESKFDWIFDMLPKSRATIDDLTEDEYEENFRLQKAVKTLSENISVGMEKKTTIISVYMKAQSPTLAQKIVDKILKYTSEAHVNVHRRSQTASFFETEFEVQKETVRKAEERLRSFRNSELEGVSDIAHKPFLSIEGARGSLQSIVNKLEFDMVDLELQKAQASREVMEYQKELSALGKFVEVPTQGVERRSTEAALEEILSLKSEQAGLESQYRNHPRLDAINNRLLALQSDVNALPVDRTEVEAVSNPAFEDVSVEKAKAVARSESLSAKLAMAKHKLDDALTELKRLNSTQVVADGLRRTVDIEKRYLDTFVDRRGDVQLINRLDKSNVSDVVVQQPGTLLVKKVSPKGSIVLPLGLLLATGLSVLTCLIFDSGSDVLSREENIEESLELPVLATIPRVSNRRVLVR